jgi:hypothetical protein
MAKSSDLLTGNLGCVAYFIGFIVVPILLAGAAYHLGAEIIGQPIIGWVFGAVAFVIGIIIGKYVAFGSLLAWFFGMMGALGGWGIDWLAGWDDHPAALWGAIGGAGGGFLLGAIATLAEDLNSAHPNVAASTGADGENPQAIAQDVPASPAPEAKVLVKPTNVPLLILAGPVLLAAPVPFFLFLTNAPESAYSILIGVPALLFGIIAAFAFFSIGLARYQCPICKKNTMLGYEDKCSECGRAPHE